LIDKVSKTDKFDPLKRSVGHVLEIIGEGWSMLIIREAFLGTRRFEEFQRQLGIARNILTARLRQLCKNEILERVPIKEGAKRHEYLLTSKGKELMPLLISLTQWGDKWIFGEGREPFVFEDRALAEPIGRMRVMSSQGKVLRPRDIQIVPGPGANEELRNRLDELNLSFETEE
jgi:DNA-binding HxlR family transcriptional regulator